MRIVLVMEGPERVELRGRPREVLKEADKIIERWKVMLSGQEKG